MRTNRIQTALKENRAALGTVLQEFSTRGVAKILERADLDFVQIDMEHSAFSIDQVADMIAWFKATEIATLVRVPQNLYHFLAGVLDAGAQAVQVADVETAEQAAAIVDACKYEPRGHRWLGLTAAHSDFKTPKAAEYLPEANRSTMVFIGIESGKGVENAESIASIDGVDALSVGANDLSNSLGVHGQLDHPRFQEAIRSVTDVCKRTGKAAKIAASGKNTRQYFDLGFRVFAIKSDVVLFRDAVKGAADEIRAVLP